MTNWTLRIVTPDGFDLVTVEADTLKEAGGIALESYQAEHPDAFITRIDVEKTSGEAIASEEYE